MECQKLLELVEGLVKSNEEIKNQISNQQEALTKEIKAIRQEILEDVSQIRQENIALREEIKELKDRLTIVDKESKKYKLVVHGLEEGQDEVSDLRGCLDLINQNLGVECRFSDIRNSFRLGKPLAEKHRPLSLETNNYFLKKEILKNSKKLKGTPIFISPDYTREEQADQKLLYQHLKKVRQSGQPAYIRNRTLIVDGQKLTLEELKRETNKTLQSAHAHLDPEKNQPPTQATTSNKRKAPLKRNLRSGSVSSNDNNK